MGNTADINDADNNEDDEIAMENCTNVPTVNVDEINESVKEMKVRITSLAPSTPTEIHSKQEKRKLTPAKLNKPPHCKTCHHPMRGLFSLKSQTKLACAQSHDIIIIDVRDCATMTRSLLRLFPSFWENNLCKKFNTVIMQAREYVNSNMAQHTECMFTDLSLQRLLI